MEQKSSKVYNKRCNDVETTIRHCRRRQHNRFPCYQQRLQQRVQMSELLLLLLLLPLLLSVVLLPSATATTISAVTFTSSSLLSNNSTSFNENLTKNEIEKAEQPPSSSLSYNDLLCNSKKCDDFNDNEDSLTENLESEIRNSVQSDIENEQQKSIGGQQIVILNVIQDITEPPLLQQKLIENKLNVRNEQHTKAQSHVSSIRTISTAPANDLQHYNQQSNLESVREVRNLNLKIENFAPTAHNSNEKNATEIISVPKKIGQENVENGDDKALTGIAERTSDKFLNNLLTNESTKIENLSEVIDTTPINPSIVTTALPTAEIQKGKNLFDEELTEHTTFSTVSDKSLSIILNETLTATESQILLTDDVEPLGLDILNENIKEADKDFGSTLSPEIIIHNVIKKQGVGLEVPMIESIEMEAITAPTENVLDANSNVNNEEDRATIAPQFDEEISTETKTAFVPQTTLQPDTTQFITTSHSSPTKGLRSITNFHRVKSNFDSIAAAATIFDTQPPQNDQTFNDNLAAESTGKALPNTHDDVGKYQSLIIVLFVGTALLLVLILLAIFLISFQSQHGTLDIEMQEQRCGKDNLDSEDGTCHKLLDIELRSAAPAVLTTLIEDVDNCL